RPSPRECRSPLSGSPVMPRAAFGKPCFTSIHVIARSASDEAIHLSRRRAMDCFASLAMTALSCSAVLLRELEYQRIHRQRRAGGGVNLLHRAVAFGAQHVLHLHGLDHGERLAGLDLLPLIDG